MTARRTRRAGRGVRSAVADAVATVHHTRPGVGASAEAHAVWWQRNAGALALVADHEDDPVRAAALRADAATARTLAAGMAAAHTTGLGEPGTVPATADRGPVLDDAAAAVSHPDEVEVGASLAGIETAGMTDVTDPYETDLMEVGL